MASQKRGHANSQYGDRNQHFNKKQKSSYNTSSYDNLSGNANGRPQQRAAFNSMTGAAAPRDSQPVLSATEMQTGLAALLDRFVEAETTPAADTDILHHARELRRLLNERNNPTSAEAARELDKKRPNKAANVVIPDYIQRTVEAAKDLPPLPPILEPHLHEAVFTHRSFHARKLNGYHVGDLDLDYERLEFLGDAYIELIASRSLYNRFPQVNVPTMSRWRELLVENVALAKFSEAYGFPDRLRYKDLHWEDDGKAWKKVHADIFEAYVAGLVLSDPVNGFSTAEKWLDTLWAPQMLNFKEKVVENLKARDELLKMVGTKGVDVKYREEKPMIHTNGVQKYFMGVYLTGWQYTDQWLGSGEGQSKAQACVAAANDALNRNDNVLQDVAGKKKALMQQKAQEREDRERAEAAGNAQGEPGKVDEKMASPVPNTNDDIAGSSTKRTSDAPGQLSEKSKKHKKDKKEKKRKAESENASS